MPSHLLELWLPFQLPETLRRLPVEEKHYFQGKTDNDSTLELVGQHMKNGLFKLVITSSKDFHISDSDIKCCVSDCSEKNIPTPKLLQLAPAQKQPQSESSDSPAASQRKSRRIRQKYGDHPNVVGVLQSSPKKLREQKVTKETMLKPSSILVSDIKDLYTADISAPSNNESAKVRELHKTDQDGSGMKGTDSETQIKVECEAIDFEIEPASDENQQEKKLSQKNEQTKLPQTQRRKSKKSTSVITAKSRKRKYNGHSVNDGDPSKSKSVKTTRRLSAQGQHLLSVEAQAKLLEYSFKCKICPEYTAVLDSTFKLHLKLKHNMTGPEYELYDPESSAPAKSGSSAEDTNDKVKDTEDGLSVKQRKRRPSSKPNRKNYTKYDKDSDENVFKCDVCGNGYKFKHSLYSHLRKTHEGHQKATESLIRMKEENWQSVVTDVMTTCPYCQLPYSGTRILSHMRLKHVEEGDFREKYSICEKMVTVKRYAKRRKKTLVSEPCIHCNKTIKKCCMKRHIQNHCKANPNVIKRYDCHWCGFYSLDKNDMAHHKLTKHSNIKPNGFICDTCGLSYKTPSALREHGRMKHGTYAKKELVCRVCPECGKKCPTKSVYTRHILCHTTETPYTCDICQRRFKDKIGLNLHDRRVHQGLYTYYCEKCGHGMMKTSHVRAHQCDRVRRKNVIKTEAESTEDTNMSKVSGVVQDDPDEIQDKMQEGNHEGFEAVDITVQGGNENTYVAAHSDFAIQHVQSGEALETTQDNNTENVFIVLQNADDKLLSMQDALEVATLSDGSSCVIVVPKMEVTDGDEQSEMYTVVEAAEAAGHILMDTDHGTTV